MRHHITTSNAPVNEYPAVPEARADQMRDDLAKAIETLEKSRLYLDAPRAFQNDMGDAIQFLVERYEAIAHR